MSVMDTGATQKKSLLAQASASLAARAAWSPLEIGFWLIALASIFLLPTKHLIPVSYTHLTLPTKRIV